MAALGLAERLGTEAVFFLPRMSGAEHGSWELLRKLFPDIRLLESASSWTPIGETSEGLPYSVPTTGPIVLMGDFQNVANFPSSPALGPRLPAPQQTPRPDLWLVHFRYGDYKTHTHLQLPLGNYYFHAITNHVPKEHTIVLVSDSPQHLPPIQAELASLGYTSIIIWTNPDVEETLQLFQLAGAGCIGGNSTFAWWGAWLSYRSHQMPIYKAYFPLFWSIIKGEMPKQIFTLSYTHTIDVALLPVEPTLRSFSLAWTE